MSLPEGRGIRRIRATLVTLAERAQSADLVSWEEMSADELSRAPREQVAALVDETMDQLDRLAEALQPPESSGRMELPNHHSSSLFSEIRRIKVECGAPQLEQVSDLAFLGAMELYQRRAELRGLDPNQDRWHLLGCLGSCAGHVTKIVTIVEASLAMLAGEQGHLDTAEQLECSLETRRLYARFRHSLLQEEVAEETSVKDQAYATLHRRLVRAASAIAQLVGRSLYQKLRITDRVQLRRLQERVITWLRREDEADKLAGERLWRDLIGFADLIMAVNRRHELEVHDRRLLVRLRHTLQGTSTASLSSDQYASLRRLYGRSEDLDILLRNEVESELTAALVIPLIDRQLLELGESHELVLGDELDAGKIDT